MWLLSRQALSMRRQCRNTSLSHESRRLGSALFMKGERALQRKSREAGYR